MLVILLAGCGSRGFLLLSAQASIAGDKHCGFVNFPFQMGVICMWSVTLKRTKGRVYTEKEVLITGHLLQSLLPHPPIPAPQVFLPVAVTLSSFSCNSPGHSVHRQVYIVTRTPVFKVLNRYMVITVAFSEKPYLRGPFSWHQVLPYSFEWCITFPFMDVEPSFKFLSF